MIGNVIQKPVEKSAILNLHGWVENVMMVDHFTHGRPQLYAALWSETKFPVLWRSTTHLVSKLTDTANKVRNRAARWEVGSTDLLARL